MVEEEDQVDQEEEETEKEYPDKLINHWKNRRDDDAPYEKGTTGKEKTETETGEIQEEHDDNKNDRRDRRRRGGEREYNNNEQHYQHRHQESGYDRNQDRGPSSKQTHHYKQARFGGLECNRESNDQQLALKPCTTFDEMKLKPDLLKGIYAYGFEKPSAIQQRETGEIQEENDGNNDDRREHRRRRGGEREYNNN
eukprot:CAMPEP_0171053258 /NCGR_PEP_ID=MMETSP0736-20130129/54359_1 /TAXON_ID=186038 /ORGANISM="Fragilariopsis kerguelensis, Strain L26-C5" /LENGTH=195 /DNA_ID=CAMNT_0011507127 /DNA_START=123 /DNA_END=706 /DNA_ORIENTATION=-